MRNLWGSEEAAERWPIRTDFGGIILLGSAMVPIMFTILVLMAMVAVPISMAKAAWMQIRGKRVNVVEAGEVERGIISCKSGSVTSGIVTEVEGRDEK